MHGLPLARLVQYCQPRRDGSCPLGMLWEGERGWETVQPLQAMRGIPGLSTEQSEHISPPEASGQLMWGWRTTATP